MINIHWRLQDDISNTKYVSNDQLLGQLRDDQDMKM